MSEINVEEILKRNVFKSLQEDGQNKKYCESYWLIFWGLADSKGKEGLINGIKEIVENAIDACANHAEADYERFEYHTQTWVKEASILQIKKMINYE